MTGFICISPDFFFDKFPWFAIATVLNYLKIIELVAVNIMLSSDYQTQKRLPTMEELPYKDGKPVDSEIQVLIAHLLKSVLANIWRKRDDWFFGIDMGWYYSPEEKAIAPDGFLSVGVERIKGRNLRLSYVTWEENGVIPSLVIEVVSKTPGGEYKEKKKKYAQYGVLYYIIYAPLRVRKQKLTLYRLNRERKYEWQEDNPLWMPEIGLGIGTGVGNFQGITREWLYWYDKQGKRYPTPEESQQQEQEARQQAEAQKLQEQEARQQAEAQRLQAEAQRLQERQARQQAEAQKLQEQKARLLAEQERDQIKLQAEKLASRLRELGIEPDKLD